MSFILYWLSVCRSALSGAWGIMGVIAELAAIVTGIIVWKYPRRESAMKNLPWMIPSGVFIVLLMAMLLTTPYAMHEEQRKAIVKLQNTLAQRNEDTKQGIRSFLESLSPEILRRVDTRKTEIGVWLGPANEVKLASLSERPEFGTFLSFRKTEQVWVVAGEGQMGDFMRPTGENGTLVGYYFHPKDALVK